MTSKNTKIQFRSASFSDNEKLIDLKHAINIAEHAAYPATTAIPALLDLSREAAAAGVGNYWRHVEKNGGAYVVGEIDGEIVCCGCWYVETAAKSTLEEYRKQAYICGIVVSQAARGRGIGRAVMEELERSIGEAGIAQIRLIVVPGNVQATNLYQSLGFEDFETVMIKTRS